MRLIIRLAALLVCLAVAGVAYAQEAPIKSFPAYGDAFGSRLSPDGTLMATFENGAIHNDEVWLPLLPIRVYDIERGEAVATLTGEPDYATDVAFSPDSTHLAALYPTGWLHIWRVADGETVARLAIAPNAARLAWPTNDTLAVAAGLLPQIQLWDANTGAMTSILTQRFTTLTEQRAALSDGPPDGLAGFASAEGRPFALSTHYNRVQLWTATGESTTIYDPGETRPLLSLMALSYTPDGRYLLALHSTENKLLVFDVESGTRLSEIESPRIRGRALAVSPDSTRAAWIVAPEDGTPHIIVANLETGETQAVAFPDETGEGWATPLTSLFFSNDGQRLILSGRFLGTSDTLEAGENPVYLIPLPR